MTQLARVLYLSAAARHLDRDDVDAILFAARRNNAANGITGILLYLDDAFLQVLEGECGALDRTLERISADDRHDAMRVLLREEVSARRFPEWSMGFHHVEKWHKDESAVFELSRDVLAGRLKGGGEDALSALILNFWRLADRHASGTSAARVGLPSATP